MIQCPKCKNPNGEIIYEQNVVRVVSITLKNGEVDHPDSEDVDSAYPKQIKCQECKYEGSAYEFGIGEKIDPIQLGMAYCEIEAAVIAEAVEKGWKIPPLSKVWEGWIDNQTNYHRDKEYVLDDLGECLHRLCSTDELRWREMAGAGYIHTIAYNFLDRLEE